MEHSTNFRQTLHLLLLCYSLFGLNDLALADPPYSVCSNNTNNNSLNTSFQTSLQNLLGSLASNASVSRYYNISYGNETDKVYGQFMCLDYVSYDDCHGCISGATQAIMNLCPNKTEAVVWEEVCQLRYSNVSFLGQLNVKDNIGKDNVINISEPVKFQALVENKLRNLTKQAAFNSSANKYATGDEPYTIDDTLYALVQCTLDLSPDECNKCLEAAIKDVASQCYGSRGARLLSRSCYLRYELYAFYEGANETSASPKTQPTTRSGGSGRKIWVIIVLTIGSAFLVAMLMASFVYCGAMKKGTRKGKDEIPRNRVQLHNSGDSENPDFQDFEGLDELKANDSYIDLATIHSATNNFSDSNMLGQGGFGPVYKGVLPDGKQVAVKRLSSFSEQGALEFTNEVLLILKLQHKNLVRLLGFCVDQQEQLLVYEFMPNSSLDVVLFDPKKRAQLNWSKRLNIINGIARGILYLHEDSRLRIIHRDLKASNVLLDFDMNPKISDFGIARIFAGADSEANTARIIGTYGYMAPEYAMEGLYSIKSDVFSFGVLLLEIITGRRNAGFNQTKHAQTLVAYAWHLWNQGNALELMDPLLTDGLMDEFLRFIHIGLLCVQEDAFDRPTMSSVVVMLKGETVTLSQPQQPAFSMGRFTKHHQTFTRSCSTNGLSISSVAPR